MKLFKNSCCFLEMYFLNVKKILIAKRFFCVLETLERAYFHFRKIALKRNHRRFSKNELRGNFLK